MVTFIPKHKLFNLIAKNLGMWLTRSHQSRKVPHIFSLNFPLVLLSYELSKTAFLWGCVVVSTNLITCQDSG